MTALKLGHMLQDILKHLKDDLDQVTFTNFDKAFTFLLYEHLGYNTNCHFCLINCEQCVVKLELKMKSN